MITVFNRRELITTLSMEVQAQGIDYTIKTINRKSPSAFGSAKARAVIHGCLGR